MFTLSGFGGPLPRCQSVVLWGGGAKSVKMRDAARWWAHDPTVSAQEAATANETRVCASRFPSALRQAAASRCTCIISDLAWAHDEPPGFRRVAEIDGKHKARASVLIFFS